MRGLLAASPVVAALIVAAIATIRPVAAASPHEQAQSAVDAARQKWSTSAHGPMLERIVPPTFAAAQLPDPGSRGAQLVVRYCVQCHHLVNPAMHDAAKWPRIVDRMVDRIRGKGNMGPLMRDMMGQVSAPDAADTAVIVAYLRRHAQAPIERARYADLNEPAGQSFRLACQQCHVLPDPRRYTAAEWPAVTARMERNMEWMNRVVGSNPVPGEPQLRIDEINAFLARHARR